MRFYSACFAGALLSSALLGGCLPAYNGTSPNDAGKKEDLAEAPIVDLATGDQALPPVMVDAGSTGTLSITLDNPTSNIRLNETMVINVTITANGATGTAALTLANAPAGLTATFNPASVTLGSAPVTSVMTVTAASDMTVVSNVATAVTATVGTDASTTTYGVTIVPKLVVHLAKGTGTTTTASHFPSTISVKLPASGSLPVDFYNDDTIEHEVHADGNSGGMAHEQGSLTANDGPVTNNGVATGVNYYETTITKAGLGTNTTATYYCHLHDPTGQPTSTIVVTQ